MSSSSGTQPPAGAVVAPPPSTTQQQQEDAAAAAEKRVALLTTSLEALEPLMFHSPHRKLTIENPVPPGDLLGHLEVLCNYKSSVGFGPDAEEGVNVVAAARGIVDTSHTVTIYDTDVSDSIDTLRRHITWCPEYGALWELRYTPLQETLAVMVMGLDEWEHAVSSNGASHTGQPGTHTWHMCGTIQDVDSDKLFDEYYKLLDEAKSTRSGNQRSAATNLQGHQKTPSFIVAVLQTAIHNTNNPPEDSSVVTNIVPPRGGYSDVGLHTGGSARHTVWPLIMGALDNEFSRDACVPSADMLDVFKLHITTKFLMVLADVGPLKYTCWRESILHVIRVMCDQAAKLEEYDLQFDCGKSSIHRLARWARHYADQCETRVAARIAAAPRYNIQAPTDAKTPAFTPLQASFDISCINNNENNTAPTMPSLPPTQEIITPTMGLERLSKWLSTYETTILSQSVENIASSLLIVRTVEQYFYLVDLDDKQQYNLTAISNIMVRYERTAYDLQKYLSDQSTRTSTLYHSRRVLVRLVVACLADRALIHAYPLVSKFGGIAIPPTAVEALSLDTPDARNMAAVVAANLVKNYCVDEGLFVSEKLTFDFIREFAKNDANMAALAKEQGDIISAAMKAREVELQDKLKKLAALKESLRVHNSVKPEQYIKIEVEEGAAPRTPFQSTHITSPGYVTWFQNSTKLENAIEAANAPLLSDKYPFPENKDQQLVYAFMCQIPELLEQAVALLANAATAVQMFLSRAVVDGPAVPTSKDGKVALQYCSSPEFQLGNLSPLRPYGITARISVPKGRCPKTLDAFKDSMNGVSFPSNKVVLHYIPMSSVDVPTAGKSVLLKFPAPSNNADQPLPKLYSGLQSLVSTNREGGETSRGNYAYAMEHLRPDEFTLQQFYLLGEVRAFPSMQLRGVCQALSSFDALPLGHPVVDVVIRQALYQMGPYGSDEKVFTWHTDLVEGEDLLSRSLSIAIDKVKDAPREVSSVSLLISIAHFLCYSDPSQGGAMSNSIGQFCTKWAEERAGDDASVDTRMLVALYRYLAARAYAHPAEEHILLGRYVSSIAAARNAWVWDPKATGSLFPLLREACIGAISAGVEMLPFIRGAIVDEGRGEEVLSTGMRGVLQTLVPRSLQWVPHGNNHLSAMYEARQRKYRDAESDDVNIDTLGPEGDHYFINVLSGDVLLNGLPVSTLPISITRHDTYIRSFGGMNFKVAQSCHTWRASPVFVTISKTAGHNRRYSFSIDKEGALLVREEPLEGEGGRTLHLLPIATASHLTRPLRELYSHWADKDASSVYLRGKEYHERSVEHVVRGYYLYWVCPRHRDLRWDDRSASDDTALVPPLEQVVSGPTGSVLGQVLQTLATFELLEFMQSRKLMTSPSSTGVAADTRIKITLLRYNLEFIVDPLTTEVEPRQWQGHTYAPRQQLEGYFRQFAAYFVLKSRTNPRAVRIIVPRWCMSPSNPYPTQPDAHLDVATFELHPTLGLLEASSLQDRLQLAALQASWCTGLPDPTGMTGVEAAMLSLGASSPTKPLTYREAECLDAIMNVAAQCPPIMLRCCVIWNLSQSLIALQPLNVKDRGLVEIHAKLGIKVTDTIQQYGVVYQRMHTKCWPLSLSPRLTLTTYEQRLLFAKLLPGPRLKGVVRQQVYTLTCRKLSDDGFKEVGETATALSTLYEAIEGDLIDISNTLEHTLLIKKDVQYRSSDTYPLPHKEGVRPSSVDKELEVSWNIHAALVKTRLERIRPAKSPLPVLLKKVRSQLAELNETRETLVKKFRAAIAPNTSLTKAARYGHVDSELSIVEMIRILLFPQGWSSVAVSSIRAWVVATILNDKMERFWIAVGGSATPPSDTVLDTNIIKDTNAAIRELSSRRVWDPVTHPAWLVFEVINRLQTWPNQAHVAMRLCKEGANGDIAQLNMGLGKTRVIVPFVALHSVFHVDNKDTELSRMMVLHELESEFTNYAALHLGGSLVAPVNVYSLPFTRNLNLTPVQLRGILHLLKHATASHSAVVSTPSSWLSMQLHLEELQILDRKEEAGIMREILALPTFDTLDEADLSLHHRFRLAYAWGNQEPLKDGSVRWGSLFALLRARSILPEAQKDDPSILLKRVMLDEQCKDIMRLADVAEKRAHIILDATMDVVSKDLCPATLALRGWLGFGTLASSCSLRYGVQYGLREGDDMAVPYRACDTPAPRAHFAHPDVSLALTTLTYLNKGLNQKELKEAIGMLLGKGLERQKTEYSLWCSSGVPTELDVVSKLDQTNAAQMEMCLRTFSSSPAVIYFWLGEVLFPAKFSVFPQQLMKTAFDVPPSAALPTSRAVGFSGTKEAHSLLPSQVQLANLSKEAPELEATDGCMLDLVVMTTPAHNIIKLNQGTWRDVLTTAMEKGVNAIIDRGGLLVGVTPQQAAHYVISKGVNAVTYNENNKWYIEDSIGHRWSKEESPIREADTMVIYDEARTRGSDMKLKPEAVALLTIDSRTTKDDFMQAVGRLRLFARNQKVIVAVPPTLELHESPLTIQCVLRYVIANSVASIESGLYAWCEAAARHGSSLGGNDVLESCPLSLQSMYAPASSKDTPLDRLQKSKGTKANPLSNTFFAELELRVSIKVSKREAMQDDNGGGDNADEVELERQQLVEEDEEEMEREKQQHQAAREIPWSNWNVASIEDIEAHLHLASLPSQYTPYATLCGLSLRCTNNFLKRVVGKTDEDFAHRRLGAYLWYPLTNTALLLTQFECSHILPSLQAAPVLGATLRFVGLDDAGPQWTVPPRYDEAHIDAVSLTLMLEDGRTAYHGAVCDKELAGAVQVCCPHKADPSTFVLGVLSRRWRHTLWDGSNLEHALILMGQQQTVATLTDDVGLLSLTSSSPATQS